MSHYFPIRLYEWFDPKGIRLTQANLKAITEKETKDDKTEATLTFFPRTCAYTGLTLRQLSIAPIVYSIQSFLKEQEIADIMKLVRNAEAAEEFKCSVLQVAQDDEKQAVVESQRNSSYILLSDVFGVVAKIKQRAALLVGMDTCYIEPIQVVKYTKGQSFGLHHDSGTIIGELSTLELEDKSESWIRMNKYQVKATDPRRVCTLFVYLNTLSSPSAGGQTRFPCTKPPLEVTPSAGTALFWRNMKAPSHGMLARNRAIRTMDPKDRLIWATHLKADPRTVHEALPILTEEDVKYGINIWVRSRPIF